MDNKLSKGFEKAHVLIKLLSAGTGACIADILTFPLDTVKVRLQIQGEGLKVAKEHQLSLIGMTKHIVKKEGALNLYNGLTAGLQRQMCFASIRIGFYEPVKNFYLNLMDQKESATNFAIGTRILAGATTGTICVVFAQPTDVVKIRFQSAAKGSESERYKTTREAYRRIWHEEGLQGLWKGTIPNVIRNAVCNVAECVSYDVIKDSLLVAKIFEDGVLLHIATASLTGVITTIVASPVDVVKTRYMNSPKGAYRNAIHLTATMLHEGPLAFYKGFIPNCARLISWNLAMWVSYEQIKILVANYINARDGKT